MLQERTQDPPIEVGGHTRLLDERARRTSARLRIPDRIEPRSGREQRTRLAKTREKTATADARHHVNSYSDADRPRSSFTRLVNSSTFERFTISVGTMICLVGGMNDVSPRTACAIRLIA
jgi:hypothetical protein